MATFTTGGTGYLTFTPYTGTGFTPWAPGYGGTTYAAFPREVTATTTTGTPVATPVTPTFDPKIEANALYGKRMSLFAGGFARIGGSPAPIVGPYINAGVVDFIVSFGVAVPVTGDRKIYAIYLDNELAWSSVTGGTLPAHGTFASEAFDFIFKPGTLSQTVCSLETEKFPGDENAYRPQMLLQIRGLPYQRFLDRTGKPVPYVACDIGDVTAGADPSDGINLGTALERIAHSPWAGYTSDTFEAVGITDVVPAILIKDNFTIVDLCRSVTRWYRNIDLLQSDKLRIKDRGSNVEPDIIFDRDSIIGGDNPIRIIRSGATLQRRELEGISIDPDQDYTAVPSLSQIPRNPFVISAAVGKETITSPLVMDASTRQALVTYTQQYEENARKKIAFKVLAVGYQVEPGDLVGVVDDDGISNDVWKVTQTLHGPNFITEIEAEAILRCSIFGGTSVTHAFRDYASDSADLAEYTFEDLDIWDAASNRYVVVGVTGSAQTRTVSALTVGGIAATLVLRATASSVTTEMWIAPVPTGTTADVVVTWTGAEDRCAVGVWAVYGLTSPTPVDTASGNTNETSNPDYQTLNSVPGGIVVAFGIHHNTLVGDIMWFGDITAADFEDAFADAGSVHFSGASLASSGTDVTLAPAVASLFNGNSPFVAATFA